eukprot:67965-Amphidinium_carterae.1
MHSSSVRAMLQDPELKKSYKPLKVLVKDATPTKETFKIKWAATNLKGGSLKRKSTLKSNFMLWGEMVDDLPYTASLSRGRTRVLIASVPIAR